MKKAKTVSEYIASAPKDSRTKLREMRKLVKAATPGSVEGIKWGMPAYSYKRILVIFGGFQHHIGLYPTTSAMQSFLKSLRGYATSKGSIQFPLDKPLPKALIKKIIAMRVKESKDEDVRWMA